MNNDELNAMGEKNRNVPKSNAAALYGEQRGVTGSSLGYGEPTKGYPKQAMTMNNYGKTSSSQPTYEKPYLK